MYTNIVCESYTITFCSFKFKERIWWSLISIKKKKRKKDWYLDILSQWINCMFYHLILKRGGCLIVPFLIEWSAFGCTLLILFDENSAENERFFIYFLFLSVRPTNISSKSPKIGFCRAFQTHWAWFRLDCLKENI